jgi:predicted Fe-Mo cluster-binding NifX family protein
MPHSIAIPASGPSLEALTDPKLPHAAYLLLVDPESGVFEAHANPAAGVDAHPGAVVAKFLLSRKVEVVLAHHMGPHPAAALIRSGVRVHEGRPGTTAAELLALYLAGGLPSLGEDEIVARHGPHRHGAHSH